MVIELIKSVFERHKTIPEKPWLTEKTGELEYNDNGVKRSARWLNIKRLHELEWKQNEGNIVKMSMLDDVSVSIL